MGSKETTATEKLFSQLSGQGPKQQFGIYEEPLKELMAYYRCAMMEIETKFRVLSEEMSIQYDRNPIETIKTRLKLPESILDKLNRKGLTLSAENIEKNLNDIAGIRVICAFPSDIYRLADSFLKQDDVFLIERKDYIRSPKDNGYRSLHLIVETPIFLHDCKKMMKAEVQFRTIAMDWWASTEHKIRYKKEIPDVALLNAELADCARIAAELDQRMEKIHRSVSKTGD